ncbi:MAG: LysR family transcriptional regulator [Rhizobacter sp.]|nr:LysR family transcriptional regulator [Rhizobacter sp.]
MLDLQQLRYFITVAETENVGQAAELLHISQSPLSRQVQQLESRLGLTLFAREKKRLKLTAAGREFLAEARALLAHAQRVQQRAHDAAAGQAGTLVVGYVAGAVHAGGLGDALRVFQRDAPGARLQLRSLRSAEQFEALRRGDLDVGFTYSAPPAEWGLVSRLVADEAFMLAVPADRVIELDALNGEPFIAPLSLPAREEMLRACAAIGWSIDIRCEAADPAAALGLVEAGVGLALVQASLARSAPAGVKLLPLPPEFAMRVRIYRVHAATPSPLAQRLMGSTAG